MSLFRAMNVYGITIDSISSLPVVILRETDDGDSIPIWISRQEAVALAIELIGQEQSGNDGRRDILAFLMKGLAIQVLRITIETNYRNSLCATVSIVQHGITTTLEIRPAEAILVALKQKIPLMIAEDVCLNAARSSVDDSVGTDDADARRFIDFLEKLEPSQMGKYPM